MKTESEMNVERLTLGIVLLILAVSLLDAFPPRFDGVAALAMGLALIASADYQHRRRWPVGRPTWLAGAAALLVGLANLVAGVLPNTATPVATLLIGLWLVCRGLGLEP